MTTQLTAMSVLFEDHFTTNGQLNSANWDYNHWSAQNNPSYLGKTQMRQELPNAEGGMARIRLDTWLNGNAPGKDDTNAFSGSEAITKQSWDVKSGGIAFEGSFKFEGKQGGMITGFFSYQDFPAGAVREPHDEIDFEILTTQLKKISTNVFAHEADNTNPLSIAVTPGSLGEFHTYRIEWLPSMVRWYVDGALIRTETQHVPTQPQQLHMNLWGVPGDWGPSPGDPNGPAIGDPNFKPATSAGQNKTYYFDVDWVKVERLSTTLGDDGANALVGTAASEAIDGGSGDDTLDGGDGDDAISGGDGNDTIVGGVGSDTIHGGAGNNIVTGGDGGDLLLLESGANTVRDTLAALDGDSIFNLGSDDALDIQGVLVGQAALTVSKGADATMLGIDGSSVEFAGDFSAGDFMTVARGVGAGAHTMVTFESFLPSLSEGGRVDAGAINGIANEPFLTGDGAVSFSLEMRSAVSAFANTFGVYKVDADGTIYDVEVLFNNTLNVPAGARTVNLGVLADGDQLGFFLIQNGFNTYGTLPDNLSFVAPGSTTLADIDAGVAPVLRSATLGTLDKAPIFHSFAALNPDDASQVLSGVAPGGSELVLGFEDVKNGIGDNDFQDVVISIRALPDDSLIL